MKLLDGDYTPESEVIPTPIDGINRVFGGGLETGQMHVLWGSQSGGKTSISYRILAEAQRMGYKGTIIDAEKTYNKEWADLCGVDISERDLVAREEVNVVEDILKDLIGMLKDGRKRCIIIDSINAVHLEVYDNKTGYNAMGHSARGQNLLLSKIMNVLMPHHIVIIIAHQTKDFNSAQPFDKASLSETANHLVTNKIRFFASRAKENVERDDAGRIIDQGVSWTVEKARKGSCIGYSGVFHFSPQTGEINNDKEIFDSLLRENMIEKSAAWYYYPSKDDCKFKGNGDKKFIQEAKDCGYWDLLVEMFYEG